MYVNSIALNYSSFLFNWCHWCGRCLPELSALWVLTLFDLDIIISGVAIVNIVLFLYKSSRCYFKILYDLFVIDFLNVRFLRFEIIVSLLSLLYNNRLYVHYYSLENNVLNTISKFFLNAIFFECEVWDMFGLAFVALRKGIYHIFLDYGFKGYPLRKDFVYLGYSQFNYNNVNDSLIAVSSRFFNGIKIAADISMWKMAE